MAQSIRDIVNQINTALAGVFTGSKLYGVAVSVEREGKAQPVVDELPVAFDDSYAMQLYHKINGVQITYRPGFGKLNNTVNTFSMSAIVFNNEVRTALRSDEIAMIMQSYLSTLSPASTVILPLSVSFNSPLIFLTEYKGTPYNGVNLFQFNYSIEVTFKAGCFDLCPSDFLTCKNN